jgi:hypothetical protein
MFLEMEWLGGMHWINLYLFHLFVDETNCVFN